MAAGGQFASLAITSLTTNISFLQQVSGIGCTKLLTANGVPVRTNLPGVGANLQDHLQLRSVYRLKHGTESLNTLANSWWGRLRMGMEYVLTRRGPLSMAPSQLGAFLKSSPAKLQPDLQWHVQVGYSLYLLVCCL